jgi:hypothetical protein
MKKDSSMNAGSLSTGQRRTSSKANDPGLAGKKNENKNDNKDDKGHIEDKQKKYYNEAYTF